MPLCENRLRRTWLRWCNPQHVPTCQPKWKCRNSKFLPEIGHAISFISRCHSRNKQGKIPWCSMWLSLLMDNLGILLFLRDQLTRRTKYCSWTCLHQSSIVQCLRRIWCHSWDRWRQDLPWHTDGWCKWRLISNGMLPASWDCRIYFCELVQPHLLPARSEDPSRCGE